MSYHGVEFIGIAIALLGLAVGAWPLTAMGVIVTGVGAFADPLIEQDLRETRKV